MASSVPLRLFFAGCMAWLITLPMVSAAERPYTGSSPGEAAESCFSIALPCACTFTERNRGQFKLLPNWWASIKLSDYKRVISVADTNVQGEFFFAGSHFVTFDRSTLPYEKVITWFKAPAEEDGMFVSGNDESDFLLHDLSTMKISRATADRGHDYYTDNRVRYISLDNTHVRAIVEGSRPYELECDYVNGEIRNLVCDCFCSEPCKHEFAAMLQLRETLEFIEKNYPAQLEAT